MAYNGFAIDEYLDADAINFQLDELIKKPIYGVKPEALRDYVDNYFEIATNAIKEMYNQVGNATFDENGIIQKGIIIRHLVLPNHIQNTKNILKWIKENMPSDIYVSIMSQYFPTYKSKKDNLINRKLTKKEYKEVFNYLYSLDLKNGYIQELGEHEEEYVPNFDSSF